MTNAVLVIGARPEWATHVQLALVRRGIPAECASNVRRALAIVERRPPSAIVLHEALLEADSLCSGLQAAASAASIPLLVCTDRRRPAPVAASEQFNRS